MDDLDFEEEEEQKVDVVDQQSKKKKKTKYSSDESETTRSRKRAKPTKSTTTKNSKPRVPHRIKSMANYKSLFHLFTDEKDLERVENAYQMECDHYKLRLEEFERSNGNTVYKTDENVSASIEKIGKIIEQLGDNAPSDLIDEYQQLLSTSSSKKS